jgi:hypothetical protein
MFKLAARALPRQSVEGDDTRIANGAAHEMLVNEIGRDGQVAPPEPDQFLG